MSKKVKKYFSREKWKNIALIGVVFLFLLHVALFGWYTFLTHKFDTLYAQAMQEGTLVQMPESFQIAHTSVGDRTLFTRPDILARESGILQSGIRSVIAQYRNDFYRLHDSIVQDIQALQTITDMSDEIFFPWRDEVLTHQAQLTTRLDTSDDSLPTLQKLAHDADLLFHDALWKIDLVKRKIVLEDILALKHEIDFIDSIYRVTADHTLVFDYRQMQTEFEAIYTRSALTGETPDQLRQNYQQLSSLLDPYRIESHKIRADAREKRQTLVENEAKKWTDKSPPEVPLPGIYSLIYVSLADQQLYAYEDGELIHSTPITSGRSRYETVTGTFRVYTKQRNKLMKSPFPDEEYELWVDYWLGFYGAYGIHDSCNARDCWRTRFGGQNYIYNGSHGCINTPYNAVKFIYNWAQIGTTVYVESIPLKIVESEQ